MQTRARQLVCGSAWKTVIRREALADTAPPLANIVSYGKDQSEVAPITDTIFVMTDVSNAYLINTADGHVLVNAGTSTQQERNRSAFDAVAIGERKYIIITQSHPDHFGGAARLVDPGTKTIADRRFPDVLAYYERIAPYGDKRLIELWEPILGAQMHEIRDYGSFHPDILVDRRLDLDIGDVRFAIHSTPGVETRDSLVVHLPDQATVFSGNLFGPAWHNLPNLYTIRGDKIRSALEYVRSLDLVRSFQAETLITGHGQPIRGRETIDAALAKMRAAVLWIHDQTVAGMCAGKDLRTLMREIELPAQLQNVGHFHGKTSWNVRAIWTEYIGWFEFRSTTELYDVPVTSIAGDILTWAGGADGVLERAREHIAVGRPLEALYLIEMVRAAEPGNQGAVQVERAALSRQLESIDGENLSETMWLKSRILVADRLLANPL